MKSIELKAEKAAKMQALDALIAGRKADGNAEERTAFQSNFDTLEGEIQRLNADIELEERVEKVAARRADKVAVVEKRGTEEVRMNRSYSVLRAIQMSADKIKFEGLEKEIHEETIRQNPDDWNPQGVAIPASYMRIAPKDGMPDNEKRAFFKNQTRDLNVTTPGDGGYTVETNLGEFIPVLMPTPIIRNLGATILTGLNANIDFAKGTNRATANWEGEVDSSAETSLTFGLMQMRPKRVSAHTIASKQLLIQSSIGMENYQRQKLSDAVSESLDVAAFNGASGGDNPVGLENISGVGAITTSGIANVNEAKAYEFKDALANAFSLKGNLAWVVTNSADSTFRQKDLATDVAIRLLGGIAGQQNDNMLKYPVFTSDLLAADSMIFGNWQELILGQWGGLDLQVNPYSLDVTAQIRITIDSWWDVNVRHAASFAMASDLN